MAYTEHIHSPTRRREERKTLGTEEARQADDRRDTVRVLDSSLIIAVLAMAILGLYFAAALAS